MRRATAIAAAGTWPNLPILGSVTLGFDARHRRRLKLADDAGVSFLLDLPAATVLADGDGLIIEGEGVIAVRAAPEPLLIVSGQTPAHLARLAWHLGNRHAPVQILSDGTLRLRDDPVLTAMLEGLGATVVRTTAPFTPEAGAYARSTATDAHDHHADDH